MNELPVESKPTHVAVIQLGNFTVGKMNQLSGLFTSDGDGWSHSGWRNGRCFSVAVNPEDPTHILLATGNGVHESRDAGSNWRILTGWEITEVLDVAFDPDNLEHLICATAFGIWKSDDAGDSWILWSNGLSSRYTPTLSISRSEGAIWTGTETGVYRMPLAPSDGEKSWHRDGLAGFAVRQIVTTETGLQVAATHSQGAWIRTIGGPWTRIRGVPADTICYAIAVDASEMKIAVGGYFSGVYVSLDRGRTATHISADTPDFYTHALAFESNRLLAGTTGDGLFALENNIWSRAGLPGTTIGRILTTYAT